MDAAFFSQLACSTSLFSYKLCNTDPVSYTHLLAVDKQSDEHNYSKVATAWQEAVRQTPHDSQVRINAALFFLKNDQRLCSSLLNSVKKDDPANVWIKAVASRLGAVKDVSDVYDLEPVSYTHLDVYKRQGSAS